MDIPAFSRDGMSGTGSSGITTYGNSMYDLKGLPRYFSREPIGPWRGKHINVKSHSRWPSSEGNYKESRDSSDAKMVWEGGITYGKSQRKSYRSRSRSPAHSFNRASFNDRSGQVATYGFRNDEPRSTSNIPCKFFATGNCRYGSFCWFSHNDRTHDSFSNSQPDDHMHGIDNPVYVAPPRASDLNVLPCYRDENEELGEQRAMRSSADDNAATENSFIAQRMDSDEPTRNDGKSHLSLTAHSSSVMGVPESRATAMIGADIDGSITYAENQLPTLNSTSRKPDVLDAVKSEAASNQCRMRNEQISRLANTLTRLLKDGKQFPELYAALSASNALGFTQSSFSGSMGLDVPTSSSNQYDPVTDSLELVNSVVSEQQYGIALKSHLLLTGGPGCDGLYGTDCRKAEWNVNSLQSNDRSGQVATYGFRNDEPRSTSTIPCKFFATGNCRYGSFCRFAHNDRTHDSFSNYQPDDHMHGIDNPVYMAPARASDLNVLPCYRDENEELGEQRAVRSSADDNAATEKNSFIAQGMDSDEPTRNDGKNHLSLTAHSSSVTGVSESRTTGIPGADIDGSITYAENQLPILKSTSRKPDVLDAVKSEAASNQCRMRNEQISRLANTLTRLLEDGKQFPESALSAFNALGFTQASFSGSVGLDVPASSSNQYDPVTDSLELVNSVVSEQRDGIALKSHLLLTGGPGCDGLYGTDCRKAEWNVDSLQFSDKALSADYNNEEQSILKAAEMKEGKDGGRLADNEGDGKAAVVKNNNDEKNLQTSEEAPYSDCKNQEHSIAKVEEIKKGQDRGKLVNNEGDDKADEIKKNNDGKSLHALKFALAEFVKELLYPLFKEGQINKEDYKTIVKNVVNKVTASVQSSRIPQTKEKIDNYLSASKPKILKLLQAYVKRVKKEKSNIE